MHPTTPWNNFTNVQEFLPMTGEIFATAGDLVEEGLYLFSNELAGVTDEFTDFVTSLFSTPEDMAVYLRVLPRRR